MGVLPNTRNPLSPHVSLQLFSNPLSLVHDLLAVEEEVGSRDDEVLVVICNDLPSHVGIVADADMDGSFDLLCLDRDVGPPGLGVRPDS